MDGGGDDPFIAQVLQEIQQKIASETARRNEKLENERAEIERRISKRDVDISANLDMIQTCLSTIREAEEANCALKRENAIDKQRKDEITTIIETVAKEGEKQLLSNLKSRLSPASHQVTPELRIAEISRPQQKATVALNGATRIRESRTGSERPVHDLDQPPPAVRRSGRATKPVEHLLDTYFTEDREPQIKMSESPTQPLSSKEEKVPKAKKRSPAEQDDHESPVPSRKKSKRESSTTQLQVPKKEPDVEPSKLDKAEPIKKVKESKSHIPLPVIAQIPNPRPKKDTPTTTSDKADKPTPTSKNTPKSDPEEEDRAVASQRSPDPVVGQVYQIEWCRKPWTAVVLPTGDLAEVGMSGTLTDTGFAPPWPGCYRKFKPRGEQPYMGFKFDYRDGNSRSHLKKYPIMYLEEEMVIPINPTVKFEPPKFNPGKYAAYAWVRAEELKPFDLEDPESRKLKGFATTRSFMRRLDKIRDIKAESRVTTSTGREGIQGLADIIINDNEDDSDYCEDSSGHSDNDEPDGGPADGNDSSDDEPQTSASKKRRTRGPSTQSRRSNSASNANSRGPKTGSRRVSEAGQWSGQHAQSQFRPVSDAEDSDSDLTSVSGVTVSQDRASSPELGEGSMNDTTPGRPETADSGPPKNRSLPVKTNGAPTQGPQSGALEGSPDLGLEADEANKPALSGTDALDGLATAAVVLAAQNNVPSPGSVDRPQPGTADGSQVTSGGVDTTSRAMTPHTRQSSRSEYQSAPASPAPQSENQPPRFPPESQQTQSSKMRLENFLRPGPPPVDRSNSNSPTKSMAEYYHKTHDFGVPIGRRPGPLSFLGGNKTTPVETNKEGFADPRDPRTIVAPKGGPEFVKGHLGAPFGNQPPPDHEKPNGPFRGPGPDARNGGRTGSAQVPPPSPRSSSSFVSRMVN